MNLITQILTVSIIGTGNVASVLGKALTDANIKILEVFSPNISNSKLLAEKLDCNYVESIEKLNTVSDLYILATPDNEIINSITNLPTISGIVVHTSGSQPCEIFAGKFENYGVFYPLQTLTKNKHVDFKDVPICIEGSNNNTSDLLVQMARKISNNVVLLNSEKREYLHLTAVTVNNFTNLLYSLAHDVLEEKGIDFSLLYPLIKETALKIQNVKPHVAQTGPARRNDISTINKHLKLLEMHPEFREIYELLSKQIIKKHHG